MLPMRREGTEVFLHHLAQEDRQEGEQSKAKQVACNHADYNRDLHVKTNSIFADRRLVARVFLTSNQTVVHSV
jgi:hypothetical protein